MKIEPALTVKRNQSHPHPFPRALRRVRHWLDMSFPLRDQSGYAEPWRRIAAASIDVILLVCVYSTMLGLVAVAFVPPSAVPSLPAWVSPIFCWLYAAVGWSFGATIGMWAVGIRVRRVEGGKPGLARAILRMVGFMLASLPVKAGLYPILTHPMRQGWHDQVARTVVVKTSAASAPLGATTRISAPSPLPADLRAGLPGWGWALAYCVVLTLVYSYPLVTVFTTSLAGVPGDSGVFAWNYWEFSYALTHHLPLTTTPLLFYPISVPLYYHTMDWFNCALAAPLLAHWGIVPVYNLLWIASLSLTTFTTYLLLAAMTRSRIASAIVAPVYSVSSFMMLEGFGHLNLITAEFLPLFALMLYAALTTRRLSTTIAAGICLGFCGLCDFHFVVFDLVLTTGLLAGLWNWCSPMERTASLARLKLAAVAFVIGGAMISWLVVPALTMHSKTAFMNTSAQAAMHRASLDQFLAPSPLSTSQRRGAEVGTDTTPMFVQQGASISLLALGLAACALALRYRRLAPWVSVLAFALVFACGPTLTVHNDAPPSVVSLIGMGFPGNSFSLPWDFGTLEKYSLDILSNPASAISTKTWVDLPYTYVPKLIPPLRAFRTPGRTQEVVLICVCILAAYALSQMLVHIQTRHGRLAAAGLIATCATAFTYELLPLPYPVTRMHFSPFFYQMAQDKTAYAVVNVPLSSMETMMVEPAVHHKAVFDGKLSRTPVEAYSLLSQNRFLQYCTLTSVRGAEFPVYLDQLTPPNLRTDLNKLRALGARYVIVHKRECTNLSATTTMMERTLGLKIVWDDSDIRAYATGQ